ncbi:transposase family protein [Methylobacterium aquaticum]|uniref:transposase family protein n=1 Tax=Methylobacterium aquaticum TaxID=270351 RepID=UPI003D7C2972
MRLDAATGCCPECGHASRSVHSRYHRHPSDLPLSTSQTKLRVEVRRFYCLNPTCRRRTFAKTPVDLLAPRARRTRRLGAAQARPRLRRCGRRASYRALPYAGKPRDRAAARHPHADARPAGSHPGRHRRLGIRKGRRYGTIVVDLDRRRVIDLLPDCTAPTVAGWLDRSSRPATEPLRVFRSLVGLGQAAEGRIRSQADPKPFV